jgi:type III restriction enzyme
LGLVIPDEFMGVSHDYEPDFLVRLVNDLNLLLEIKGYEVHNPEQTNSKHNATRRWVAAVNNLGEFGKWDFLVCRDLDQLFPAIARILGRADGTVTHPNPSGAAPKPGHLFG